MRRVRAKVAHTLEPGCRYVRAGEEIDIPDADFSDDVHEHLQPHKEPNADGALVLPPGVEPPERPKPGSLEPDLQFSTPLPYPTADEVKPEPTPEEPKDAS